MHDTSVLLLLHPDNNVPPRLQRYGIRKATRRIAQLQLLPSLNILTILITHVRS